MKKLLALISTTFLALLLPAVAFAAEAGTEEEEFDPSHEWMTHEWIPIHLGPLNLSITKPVVARSPCRPDSFNSTRDPGGVAGAEGGVETSVFSAAEISPFRRARLCVVTTEYEARLKSSQRASSASASGRSPAGVSLTVRDASRTSAVKRLTSCVWSESSATELRFSPDMNSAAEATTVRSSSSAAASSPSRTTTPTLTKLVSPSGSTLRSCLSSDTRMPASSAGPWRWNRCPDGARGSERRSRSSGAAIRHQVPSACSSSTTIR